MEAGNIVENGQSTVSSRGSTSVGAAVILNAEAQSDVLQTYILRRGRELGSCAPCGISGAELFSSRLETELTLTTTIDRKDWHMFPVVTYSTLTIILNRRS